MLWSIIAQLKKQHTLSPPPDYNKLRIIVYIAEGGIALDELEEKLASSFNIHMHFLEEEPFELHFQTIPMATGLLSALSYPRFTMIGQSIGSVKVVMSGLRGAVEEGLGLPDVFIDTTGAIFTLLAVKYFSRFCYRGDESRSAEGTQRRKITTGEFCGFSQYSPQRVIICMITTYSR